MRSALAAVIRKATGVRSLSQPQPFGAGIYGERYSPETRRDFVEAYRDRVWVQRCINYVANATDSVPIKQFTGTRQQRALALRAGLARSDTERRLHAKAAGGAPKEVENQPLADLFDRPNPRDPALRFFGSTAKWGQMIGEWSWEIVPAVGGGIAELYQVRQHLVHIVPDPDRPGHIKGFTYDPNETGQIIEFDAAEPETGAAAEGQLLYGRYANPLDDYYGLAPLRGAKDDVISEYYAIRYDHRFFRNSARPDIILSWPNELDDEQRQANRDEWLAFKGVDQAHRAAVLDGDPKVHELGKTPQDVAYLEGRKLAREGECGALGVPPVLVGILDHATYSNYSEAEPIFWRATMIPLLSFLASWATWSVLPYFKGNVSWIEFDTSGVEALQINEGARIDRVTKATGTPVFTIDEGRDELGKEPLPDGLGDQVLIPISLMPLEEAAVAGPRDLAPDAGGTQAQPGADPAAAAADAATADQAAADAAPADGTGNGTGDAQPASAAARARAAVKSSAARYMMLRNATVRQAQVTGRNRVAHAMAEQEQALIKAITADEGKGTRADRLRRKAAELVAALEAHDWNKDATALAKAIAKTHLAVAVAAGEHAGLMLGVEIGFTAEAGPVARVVQNVGARPTGIRSVAGRVKTDVLEEVRAGIAAGLTHQQIAQGGRFDVGPPGDRGAAQADFKGVRGVFAELKGWQAERIARTEAATSYNVAAAAAFREAGVQEVEIVDGDDDPECGAANGSTWTVDEYDSNPLEHPNCTRLGLPVVGGGGDGG